MTIIVSKMKNLLQHLMYKEVIKIKILAISLMLVLLLAPLALANNLGDYLKGGDSDYPLNGAVYVAYNLDNDSLAPDRVKVEYIFAADQLRRGTTQVSVGWELGK